MKFSFESPNGPDPKAKIPPLLHNNNPPQSKHIDNEGELKIGRCARIDKPVPQGSSWCRVCKGSTASFVTGPEETSPPSPHSQSMSCHAKEIPHQLQRNAFGFDQRSFVPDKATSFCLFSSPGLPSQIVVPLHRRLVEGCANVVGVLATVVAFAFRQLASHLPRRQTLLTG